VSGHAASVAYSYNSQRMFPKDRIAPSVADVTDDFVRYARPLIGDDWPSVPLVNGIQRFARITRHLATKRLPEYLPQAWRGRQS
jgi:hypothetical protein